MGGMHEERILFEKIQHVGGKLVTPPSSDEELLSLLEELESLLSAVNQLTSTAFMTALQPMMTVLADNGMLSHPNADVSVAVLSCICEVMRITAPNMPYNDDAMKLVFQRIIMSFERIDDLKSRSYRKIVSILESLAELRSCIVMLDLKLNDLILKMFEHFLQRISLQHPPSIFWSMEKIMTTIIKESESDEISEELVSCLLWSVKRERMVHLSVSFTLGENVIKKCADKLKPLVRALVGNNRVRKYSKVVVSLCQETSDDMEQCDADASFKNEPEANKSERAVPDKRSQKLVKASDNQLEAERQEILGSACVNRDAECAEKPCSAEMNGEEAATKCPSVVTKRTPKAKDAEVITELPVIPRKGNAAPTKPAKPAMLELASVPKRQQSVTAWKAVDVNRLVVRPASDSLTQDIQVKTSKRPLCVTKRTPKAKDAEAMTTLPVKSRKRNSAPAKQTKSARLQYVSVPEKQQSVTAIKAGDANKLVVRQASGTLTQIIHFENSNVAHRSGFKRKRGPVQIVGKRIRVWWPVDKMFYDGTIEKYYRSYKRHMVIYDDGDFECLLLKDEIWEFIEEEGEASSALNKREFSRSKKVRKATESKDCGSYSKLPLANSALPIGWI